MKIPEHARFLLLLLFCLILPVESLAQLVRERSVPVRPVELTFPASRHIILNTTEPLASGEFYYSIMHAFGTVENGITDFWGLDQGANIQFRLEYGFHDRFSVFAARSSMDKIYDIGFRFLYLQQMTGGGAPVSASVVVTAGLMTEDYSFLNQSYRFTERNQLSVSLPVSRKINDRVSVLGVPMAAVFSFTNPLLRIDDPRETDELFAGMGFGSRYKFTRRTSLTVQYVSAYQFETEETRHQAAIGLDMETGGHVFQIFFTNSRALNDAYLLGGSTGNIAERAFRFGFNINRSFQMR